MNASDLQASEYQDIDWLTNWPRIGVQPSERTGYCPRLRFERTQDSKEIVDLAGLFCLLPFSAEIVKLFYLFPSIDPKGQPILDYREIYIVTK